MIVNRMKMLSQTEREHWLCRVTQQLNPYTYMTKHANVFNPDTCTVMCTEAWFVAQKVWKPQKYPSKMWVIHTMGYDFSKTKTVEK